MAQHAVSPNRSWWAGLSASVVLGGMLLGCTPDVTETRKLGIQHYRDGDRMASMATLRRALNDSPSDAQCNYYMGMNYRAIASRKFGEGDYAAAYRELERSIFYFTQAVKTWPNYMTAIAAKNEALEAKGQYGDALALAEGVTVNTRGFAGDHYLYLGHEYLERGDYDNALRSYEVALENNPDSAAALAAMGGLYERVNKPKLARTFYQRAYALNEAEPGVSIALARLGRDTGVQPASHEQAP